MKMRLLIRNSCKCLIYTLNRFGMFYIRSRMHYPGLLNAMGLTGCGVEIGVAKGVYSDHILREWKGTKLYSVDPWYEYPSETYRDTANVGQEKQEDFYLETKEKLKKYGNRSEVLRMPSEQAATRFSDKCFDFVYIDAQHHYEAVMNDIKIWYPKVKKGGIISGHDYFNGKLDNSEYGVKRAVDEFAFQNQLRVYKTVDSYAPSWFIPKPR